MLDSLLQFVPAHLHREYLGLLSHVPGYARYVAVAGHGCAAIGAILKRRPGITVTGATHDPKAAALAGEILDRVVQSAEDVRSLDDRSVEALVLCNLESDLEGAFTWVKTLLPKLSPTAHIYALHGDPSLGGGEPPDGASLGAEISERLAALGYHLYLRYPLAGADALHVAIPEHYDPIHHARALIKQGDPGNAFLILDVIPDVYLKEPEARLNVWVAKLEAIACCLENGLGGDPSNLMNRAQDVFYSLADFFSRLATPYRIMARCWVAVGNPDMARRLLTTIQHVSPEAATQQQLDGLPPASPSPALSLEAPAWARSGSFRVLFIVNPRLHFGLDGLYDGLCDCLGDENVVDYPFKPTLHGQDADAYKNYPCRYNRRGRARTFEDVLKEVQAGAFDAILYGDVEGDVPLQEVGALIAARGTCPVYLVDAMDQLTDFRTLLQQRIGLPSFTAYFKREMAGTIDYGPHAYPLPFAHVPVVDPAPFETRTEPFFWAGHRQFGQRRVFLDTLEARYGWDLGVHYEQLDYQKRLNGSRIGLNCYGMGFDTVRYWELPARGCMMLSERLPIWIPHNFVDGVHAVFFDNLPALLEKLDYYLAHPAEAAAIADAGHAHFLKYHTNTARARQALGWIEATRPGNTSGAWA